MVELRDCDFARDDLEEIAELLRETIPGADRLTAEYLDWGYRRNPVGVSPGCSAFDGDRLVAHAAGRCLRARVHGREERGVLIHHAATRPGNAGSGLFTALVERILETAAAQGFAFALAIPNANSEHAIVHKLDFQPVAHLSVRVGLGAPPAPGGRSGLDFAPLWDERALTWRLARPGSDYAEERRNGRRLVLVQSGVAGIRAVLGEVPESCAGVTLPEARGGNPVRVWIGLDDAREWSRSAYLPVPVRWRPAPLRLTFRDLGGGERRVDRARARFDALDFDPY